MTGRQLRLSRPAARKPRMERMTERQRTLLKWLRYDGGPCEAERLGRLLGYLHPSAACDRLVRRGLVRKVKAGVYQARRVTERKV